MPDTDQRALLVIGDVCPEVGRVIPLIGMKTVFASAHEALLVAERGECQLVVCTEPVKHQRVIQALQALHVEVITIQRDLASAPNGVWVAPTPGAIPLTILQALGRVAANQSALFQRVIASTQAIASAFTLPALTEVATANTRELTTADGASLLLIDSSGALCFEVVAGSKQSQLHNQRLRAGSGVAGAIARTRQPRLVANVSRCDDFDPTMDIKSGFRTGSIVGAPLLLNDKLLGVLMAVRQQGSHAFTYQELYQIEKLASQVAIAVYNVQMTSALLTTEAALRQANTSLEERVRERTIAIHQANSDWEHTFNAIDEPIAVMNGFVVSRANRAWARKAGVHPHQVEGRRCHQLLAGLEVPCRHCPLTEKQPTTEVEIRESSSSAVFRVTAHADSSHVGSTVVHYQNVTHERRLQGQLRESERLAAVGQLAAGAAHEINNPLSFITSNLRSLKSVVREERPNLEESDSIIDESLEGTRRIADIIKALRALSELDLDNKDPCDVNAAVTRVSRAEIADFERVALQLRAAEPANIPPLQFDHALSQLVRNACQATGAGQQILISTWSTTDSVFVRVSDEGEGISQEHLRRVFEPFFTTKRFKRGIGLGLTAAYGIVQRVNGHIVAESDGPGTGARFTVRLPSAERSTD